MTDVCCSKWVSFDVIFQWVCLVAARMAVHQLNRTIPGKQVLSPSFPSTPQKLCTVGEWGGMAGMLKRCMIEVRRGMRALT